MCYNYEIDDKQLGKGVNPRPDRFPYYKIAVKFIDNLRNNLKILKLILPLLLLSFNLSFGQDGGMKMMYIDSLFSKYKNNVGIDTIRNVHIIPMEDEIYDTTKYKEVTKPGDKGRHYTWVYKDTTKMHSYLVFINCKINSINLHNLNFSGSFYNCQIENILFDDAKCGSIAFIDCNIKSLSFYESFFRRLNFINCKFSDTQVDFFKCTFETYDYYTSDGIEIHHDDEKKTIMFSDNENLSLAFDSCIFFPSKKNKLIEFGKSTEWGESNKLAIVGSSFQNFSIKNSEFYVPTSFVNVKVNKLCVISDNKFNDYITFKGFQSIFNSTFIDWKNIKKRLFLVDGYLKSFDIKNDKIILIDTLINPYYPLIEKDLLDDKRFNELQATYNYFTTLYTTNGDAESRNAVYVEKKQLLTERYKAVFHHHKNFTNLVTWQLNKFLSWFCDYATNPVKALLNCFYLMLFFSAFYFIFPSQPDNLYKYRFIGYFNKSIEYFSTDKSLAAIHKEYHKEHLMQLNSFKRKLKRTKGLVPKTITLFGLIFLNIHYFGYNIINKLLIKIDLNKRSWKSVTKGKKIYLSILTGIYYICFVINGIIIRAINAIMLSLNSFVTLGAAGIETKGISRYVTVVEGSVGWFFLTIFAVTLIKQLIE